MTAADDRPAGAARRRLEWHLPVDAVLLAAALWWTLSANTAFFAAALRDGAGPGHRLGWLLALGLALTALHVLLVAPFATRRSAKPLLALLSVGAAAAGFYMGRYGVVLDPDMLRNVLHTHPSEARELLGPALLVHLLVFAGLPLLLLARVRFVVLPRRTALKLRAATLLVSLLVLAGALLAVAAPFSSLMRNQKEARYLVTPANLLYSSARVLAADARGAVRPREPIGLDAGPGPSWAGARRPRVVVMVVGETARAANWGLNGYARQTTPELAALPVVNFSDVTSCGTATEVSLPCMFAPVGRRDYDESRIRGQESLLHVVARAGVGVRWRDNQSGCKGVCEGLPSERIDPQRAGAACSDAGCLDEGLLEGLDAQLDAARGTQLWVLHPLGNHGPAYAKRYPPAFARFQPDCRSDDLGRCSREEIVNAYDNALLYTDHVLATLVAKLQAHADRVDAALVYVSDHGESLGENGLYLHGLPYPIAPREQTQVPMLMWLSPGFAQATRVEPGCLRARAAKPASHDHLFHTLLGLLDVRTTLYEPAWDLGAECRAAG